jgi:hypothetical protein
MPRSSKPRKQHRPKAIGRPVLRDMHRELILPAYVSIETLRTSTDPEAGDAAYHQLGTVFMYMAVALQHKDDETRELLEAGKRALLEVGHRQQRAMIDKHWKGFGQSLPRSTGPAPGFGFFPSPLTENQIRRIVREEIQKALRGEQP